MLMLSHLPVSKEPVMNRRVVETTLAPQQAALDSKSRDSHAWARARLERMRRELLVDVAAMATAVMDDHRAASGGHNTGLSNHPADFATDEAEHELTVELLEGDERQLDQVEAALARLKAGNYGSCTACGRPIPAARLRVLPHTPYCVACAQRDET